MIGTLRFLLALGVVASHTHGYRFDLYPDTGIISVCAFFVISGYLMPATLEKNYGGRALPYLANRFLRIFPIYWIALGLALVLLPRLPEWVNQYDFGLRPIVQNILLLGLNEWHDGTRYIGPAWTLDIELQYYLLVPLLMLLRRNLLVVVALLIGAAPIIVEGRSFFGWSGWFVAGLLWYLWRPNSRFFLSRNKLDRELGDLAYPLFVLHPIVIQTSGLQLSFWPLMLGNMVLSVLIATVIHYLASPYIDRLRARNREIATRPAVARSS